MEELARYGLILKRHWFPALLVFLAVSGLTTAWTLKQKPVFQAKAQVLLKKTNAATGLFTGLPGGGLDSLAGTLPTSTQAEVLRSEPIARETIKRLSQPTIPLQQRLVNVTPEQLITRLKVAPVKSTDILEVTYQDTSPERAQRVVNTLVEIYRVNDVESQQSEARSAREFIGQELPKLEGRVRRAEAALRSFKEQNEVVDLPTEATKSVEAITALNREITNTSSLLQAATAKIERLRGILGQDEQAAIQTALVSESPGLQKALVELQEVQKKLALERTRFADDNPVIQDLVDKERALTQVLQQRYQQSLVNGVPFRGRVVELQRQGVQENLINDFAKTEAERVSLERQLSALTDVANRYRARVNYLPRLEEQQRVLERELEAAQATYKALLTKQQEIGITEKQTLGNTRVIAEAVLPDVPVSPKIGQNIAIGSFLGMFLGAATAFAIDATDKRIKTAEEAKQMLGFPVLGNIPAFNQQEFVVTSRMFFGDRERQAGEIVLDSRGSDRESEAFRMLQANLRFLSTSSEQKVIVISSSLPREGKSTVAANLAYATSELGRRVLLVDADMRKPSQHRIWRQSNDLGLSNLLTGQCTMEEATIDLREDLSLICAGVIPPNPVALLDSTQMRELIAQWGGEYDLVIIDTPPLTVAADATLLSKIVEGIVLVVRPNVADRDSVSYTRELLEQSDQRVLGMVLNGIRTDNNKLYGDYYYSRRSHVSDRQKMIPPSVSGLNPPTGGLPSSSRSSDMPQLPQLIIKQDKNDTV
jgi:polysaccharide biosynthesis transport protein